MRHLNYHHLLYFWTVAREGSIAKAAESLHLTPQTISGQLKLLDEAVGNPLFQRSGRNLALTDVGQMVKTYADEIFGIGAELAQAVRNPTPGRPTTLHVGVVNSIAKLIAYRMLEPALRMDDPLRLICVEGPLEQLLGDLSVHRIDLVLSDRPLPLGLHVKAYGHDLGRSDVAIFAHRDQADRYSKDFPISLNGAPMLLPTQDKVLRRNLDDWMARHDLKPRIIAELEDSALLKAFGEAGRGLFPAPDAISREIELMYHCVPVGIIDGISESYFALSTERRIKHPAVSAITRIARDTLSHD